MILLCYPKCTTCQGVKKVLDEQGVKYEDRDIKLKNPTKDELKEWWTKSGLPLKRFYNTSGLLYKSMNLKERILEMSEEQQLELLATDGMLVKRPLMVDGDHVYVGKKDILAAYS